jgi:hypothetical protein
VNNQRRLSRRMFLTASSYFLIQKNLTCRLSIVQNTIFVIIDCKNFWILHTYSSISRVDDERDKIVAFFSTSLIFFKSIDFHVFREIRDEFDLISQSMRIEIDMWFDDWLKSNLVVQCSNLSIKWIVINVKSMMLTAMRFSHVMNFLSNVSVKSCFFIMFRSCHVMIMLIILMSAKAAHTNRTVTWLRLCKTNYSRKIRW